MIALSKTYHRKNLPFALALIPIFILTGLIVFKTVNVPYWDQWEFVPLIQHVHSGHFYFNDFWQQQNEHRLVFPRLIMIISAMITKWNIRVESVISLGIAISSFIIILKTLKLTQQELKQKSLFLLPLLLSLIWFSPVQAENWLWGWQIQWFLNVLGIVLVTFGIAHIKKRTLPYPTLILMLLGGILAAYSLGSGVIIWPLLVAVLLYSKVPFVKTLIAAVTGLITTGLYYHNYVNVSSSSPSLVLREPVLFIKYVLVYLGKPLSFAHGLAPLLGLVLLLVFVSLTSFIFIKKKSVFNAVVPWVVLGLYAIGTSMVTASSRMGLGLEQAYNSSRYTTIASLLLVSTIIICVQCRAIIKEWLGGQFQTCAYIASLAVFALVFINAGWGIQTAYVRSQSLKDEQTCTHQAQPSEACLLSAYPYPNVLQPRLDYLKQIHWAGY